MNVTEAIYSRRATRAYTPRPVDDATLDVLLHAAVQAPSAMNTQPWLFAVLQDRAQLRRFSDRAKAELLALGARDPNLPHYESRLRDETYNIFYDAGTLIVIGVNRRGQFSDADGWLAAQNVMLTARQAGLGSCCIGFAIHVLNQPEIKRELCIPADGAAIAPIIVGYPSAGAQPVPRTEPRIVFRSKPA
jgi:nitroreductase